MLISSKTWFYSSPFNKNTESMINVSFWTKTVFYSLPNKEPAIANRFHPLLIIAEISGEFLDPLMTTKYDYLYC